jgi:mRNA turnover protein 4
MTQVNKKTREDKEKLFQNIRDAIPEYQHCFVFSVDNMRNSYLKQVRHEMSDSRSGLRSSIVQAHSLINFRRIESSSARQSL